MLYRLDRDDAEKSVEIEAIEPQYFGIKEKQIEDFLRIRLYEVVSSVTQLMLIGQQRPRQEEADLLALDRDGILYIFELKRGRSQSENILQVMRYGQKFGRFTYSELNSYYRGQGLSRYTLQEQHQKYFQLNTALLEPKFNAEQVFVLVTNGVDEDTLSAINYWRHKGIRIDCAPYRIYNIHEKFYIYFDIYHPSNEVQADTDYFIVNTNSRFMPNAWKDMVGDGMEGVAAAYYDKKYAIQRINTNSTVYLYHTRVGVIAKGQVTGNFQMGNCDGHRDEKYYVPLRFDWALADPDHWGMTVQAPQINGHMGTGHRFRQTVFSISKNMKEAIDQIAGENGIAGAN